jgi:hypothetical protein
MFTSGLTVNEFALLTRLGPSPLAQVMGASVVQTGWQYLPPLDPGKIFISGSLYAPTPTGRALTNVYTEPSLAQLRAYRWYTEVVCELDVLTDAWNLARRRALERLREEAIEVGADAVVGVHLRHSDHDIGKGTIECVVSGTAVRLPHSPGAASPALSALSVQDYWRLNETGHEPVGLLATTVAVFASPARSTRVRRARTISQNQELGELSRAFQVARETVRTKLRGQISDARGTGAVGVGFSHSVARGKFALASSLQTMDRRGWHRGRLGLPYRITGAGEVDRRGWLITMHATGTAIRAGDGRSPYPVKAAVRMGTG